MDKLNELEVLVDKVLKDYTRLKEENEQLWSQMNEALSKIERLDKEKRELETLVESYRSSLSSLVERLQKIIGITESAYEEKYHN
ncbi:MAG TPA: hypothetical protein PLP64_08690 [Pseudothermotoga sp.]|nr:hypothetical protein [Pseudothermotoga sp.]HOK84285.1 hypothetical protein [Pseudothermotoga sp.]HPP70881.1 hypothetical protein [Pseudothermotoga sp.]